MTEYLDRYPTMHEYAEGKRINPKLTDLISRADAIDAVCEECSERWGHYKECDLYKDGQCFEITALMALPSADAVQGEWVIRENGNKECSLCGHERQDGWDYFCGFCGARMKGGAE